jgi:O-methyltransferase
VNLSSKEINTKGFELFKTLLAMGLPEECREIATVVMKHSKSDEVKRRVREDFIALLVQRYGHIVGFDADDFNFGHAKLVNLYCGGAHKKLNISTDIDVFSELATKHINAGRTLLRYDRLYTLFQSLKNTANLPGDVIELGVYRGGSLKFAREVLDIFRVEKNIIGFDTFCGHATIHDKDEGGVQKKGLFVNEEGIAGVRDYIADPRVRLVEGDASLTLPEYAKNVTSISLAHLDMDVYKPTADALPIIFERLPSQGVILLDDYGFTSCVGVKRAVDEFLTTVNATSLHLMTGQMVITKP